MVGNLPTASTGRTRLTQLFRSPAECEFEVVEGLTQSDSNKNVSRSQELLAFGGFTYYFVAQRSPLLKRPVCGAHCSNFHLSLRARCWGKPVWAKLCALPPLLLAADHRCRSRPRFSHATSSPGRVPRKN